jgi:hypothetical protein
MVRVTSVPDRPKIYHITHTDNLPGVLERGCLWSEARCLEENWQCTIVGMSQIKKRRLQEIEVGCHPGTTVGQYVPFYFCPRSIMLYILYKGNHPDVDYHGGQQPILHLQADLTKTVAWADKAGRSWAFSDGNAGARYTRFYNDPAQLDAIDWAAVVAVDWQNPLVKEGKQAEFLMLDSFPWELIETIGVIDQRTRTDVSRTLRGADHKPLVSVQRNWYY